MGRNGTRTMRTGRDQSARRSRRAERRYQRGRSLLFAELPDFFLTQNTLHNVRFFHPGEADVEALVFYRESFVIEA